MRAVRVLSVVGLVSAVALAQAVTAHAGSARPGGPCTKKDALAHDSSTRGVLVCTVKGSALVWRASAPTGAPPTITASPIDPAHVVAISKFRSCSGHDFSPGAMGHGRPGAESARSMKHYLLTDVPTAAADSVPVFAPIDGQVDIQRETFPLGQQVYISRGAWSVRLFHVDPTVATGAAVKAGQQIGWIPPANAVQVLGDKRGPDGQQPGYEFDVAVTSKDNSRYVSMLDVMSPDVARLWAVRGFTPAAAVITRAARDAQPCTLGPDGERFTPQEDAPADWVQGS